MIHKAFPLCNQFNDIFNAAIWQFVHGFAITGKTPTSSYKGCIFTHVLRWMPYSIRTRSQKLSNSLYIRPLSCFHAVMAGTGSTLIMLLSLKALTRAPRPSGQSRHYSSNRVYICDHKVYIQIKASLAFATVEAFCHAGHSCSCMTESTGQCTVSNNRIQTLGCRYELQCQSTCLQRLYFL